MEKNEIQNKQSHVTSIKWLCERCGNCGNGYRSDSVVSRNIPEPHRARVSPPSPTHRLPTNHEV
jgi:hypothetical protein